MKLTLDGHCFRSRFLEGAAVVLQQLVMFFTGHFSIALEESLQVVTNRKAYRH